MSPTASWRSARPGTGALYFRSRIIIWKKNQCSGDVRQQRIQDSGNSAKYPARVANRLFPSCRINRWRHRIYCKCNSNAFHQFTFHACSRCETDVSFPVQLHQALTNQLTLDWCQHTTGNHLHCPAVSRRTAAWPRTAVETPRFRCWESKLQLFREIKINKCLIWGNFSH